MIEGGGRSGPGEIPWSGTLMHGEGFGVSPDVYVSGACVPPRAFSDSMSNGPGDLLGINHTSLHLVLQELGASLTCRVLAFTAFLINACRISP